MRKLPFLLVLCLCLFLGAAQAEEITAFGQQFAKDAQVIDLGSTQLDNVADLTALLAQLPQVHTVNLYESKLSREDMALLFDGYPNIFFGFTIRIAEHTIRTDQTAFSTLHNNKMPTHSSEDFAPLRFCTKLQALDLGHNKITDISFIENLTDLRVLILALNQIEDITPLKNLDKLEYAELFRNKIKDISVLSDMPLLDLNLCYNYISDLSPLYDIKTLERLWLYKSTGYGSSAAVPRDTLNALKESLPNAYIDAKTFPTGGGWREHPRFFVIFDIFKNAEYKPFEPMEGTWKP